MTPRPRFDTPIAHRGLHDRAAGVIENSAAAFEAAIARGFHIECDLQLSRDGVPVVFHDDDLDRLTALSGRLDQRTADELTATPLTGSAAGDCPQRFTAFLAQVAGRTLLQIELKAQPTAAATRTLARAVTDALRNYRGPVVLESFDPNLLHQLRRHGCALPLGIITYRFDGPEAAEFGWHEKLVLRNLLHWPLTRFAFISCHDQALDMPAVRLFRSLGLPVTAWTTRSAAAALATRGKADQIVFEGFDPTIA